ncbi:MAG TPA: sulfotransferase [Anaerolineales bacterium]
MKLFKKESSNHVVTIVSGLPRSGTSMMMKMLEAGGLPPLTDEIRTADKDNPKGYYEFERVKKMPDGDKAWMVEARGKSVKVISALLEHLPPEYSYKIIFMRRNMTEILASQKKMLIRQGKPTDKVSDEELAKMYEKHLAKVQAWLATQPNVSTLDVDYNMLLENPRQYLEQIQQFLGTPLNVDNMGNVVDPALYRQRRVE